ncbi:MAG TPA: hypothetical protein VMG10_10715 [Gemmataceae bacterium]|nr:hypothetical protein [Gemmataceae bacterium]
MSVTNIRKSIIRDRRLRLLRLDRRLARRWCRAAALYYRPETKGA